MQSSFPSLVAQSYPYLPGIPRFNNQHSRQFHSFASLNVRKSIIITDIAEGLKIDCVTKLLTACRAFCLQILRFLLYLTVCSTQSRFRSLMLVKPTTNAKLAVISGQRCMLSGEWYVDGRIELECLFCWDVFGQCSMLLGTATVAGSANYATLVDSLDILLSCTKSHRGCSIRLHLLLRS